MPDVREHEDVRTLSVLQASKLTGLARDTITAAMRSWTESHGRDGLRWLRLNRRRMLRLSSLREWFAAKEMESRHVW